MRVIFIPLILGFLLSLPVFAKGPPPGTGVGDVKANIMIMLDDSGSMSARDPSPGLSYCTYAVDVANNGDIFTVDPCYHRANRLDSSFKIKATIGGSYSQYNNDGSGNATFRQPWSLALDHDDSTDEFVFIGSREVRGRGSFSGRSTMSKVCTGITTTAACPKAGKLVATNTYIDNQNYTMGIAVQGNYVYTRTYNRTYLYKYNKSDFCMFRRFVISVAFRARVRIFRDLGIPRGLERTCG